MSDRQKQLKEFLERRHPDYAAKVAHWQFLEATYEGGREWFAGNIFRYLKEGDKEFKERLERCYRFNHTRECTDLVQKYIFKSPVIRDEEDAEAEIKEFWANATLQKLDINQFMKLVSTASSKLGRTYVVVDTTAKGENVSKADAKKNGDRVYSYNVSPVDVLDMGFSEDGELLWILIREIVRDDKDPILASGNLDERFRLWTKTFYQVFTVEKKPKRGGKVEVTIIEGSMVPHKCGQVPVFPVDHVVGENVYSAPALINDIAYLDRAVANYLSNLDAIIQDQTFSQLAMPAQNVMPGQDSYDALIEAGTKRTFLYDGEGGAKPEFISPDPRQAAMIITVINKIIAEIYHTIGMAGERTKDDNAAGIDNSSGVAKAYDFERMNSLLTSKADSLENAENRLVELVLAWNGKPAPESELVKYPDTFDVRSLFDEFMIAEKLALVQAPETLRQEQMKQIVDKLFPRLSEDLKAKMEADLKSWPPKLDPLAPAPGGGKPPTKFPATSKAKPASQKQQGQVTKDTVK